MKRSQIALLSVGGILAGIVIVSVVSARIALSHGGTEFLDSEAIAGGAGLRGFDGVEVAGRWQVNVSRGDDWRVDLSYPEDLEDRIKVRLRGDRLWLEFKSGAPWNEPDFPSPRTSSCPNSKRWRSGERPWSKCRAFGADGSK